jgi:hypothetical protein
MIVESRKRQAATQIKDGIPPTPVFISGDKHRESTEGEHTNIMLLRSASTLMRTVKQLRKAVPM